MFKSCIRTAHETGLIQNDNDKNIVWKKNYLPEPKFIESKSSFRKNLPNFLDRFYLLFNCRYSFLFLALLFCVKSLIMSVKFQSVAAIKS